MDKKTTGVIAVIVIIVCIGYIAYDIITGRSDNKKTVINTNTATDIITNWEIVNELRFDEGTLKAVSSYDNILICGGDSFLVCLDKDYNRLWNINTDHPVNALTSYGDTIFAATNELIKLYDRSGNYLDEWGPYDQDAMITGISANRNYIAIADAANKLVFVLNKTGALKSIAGHPGNQFIIPSPYFDVALTVYDTLLIANTGNRHIEFRTIDGDFVRSIGEEGDSMKDFCGCCNPAHLALSPAGDIVTAEKGINRIKILHPSGRLLEPVAQESRFKASIPLDIAVGENGLIYGAYRGNSTLYTFQKVLFR